MTLIAAARSDTIRPYSVAVHAAGPAAIGSRRMRHTVITPSRAAS